MGSALQLEKELGQVIARTPFLMHLSTSELSTFSIAMTFFRFLRRKLPFDLSVLKHFLTTCLLTLFSKLERTNKNKKYANFQKDKLNFYGFIQIFVFTTNHHFKDKPMILHDFGQLCSNF